MNTTAQESWKAQQQARAVAATALHATHPHLIPDTGNSLVTAAKNIRIELKATFPGVKFSVRSSSFSMGNSIDVRWTDGPTTSQVDEIINKYTAGSFDGMTDCYNYERGAWTDAFGDAKYVHSSRDYSEKAIAGAIRSVFNRYPGNLVDVAVPAVDDFRMGRLWNVRVDGLGDTLQSLVNVELSRRTWSIGQGQA